MGIENLCLFENLRTFEKHYDSSEIRGNFTKEVREKLKIHYVT